VLVSAAGDSGEADAWTQDEITLAPGERGIARVSATPTGFGRWSRVFNLATNDPRQPKARMLLSATIQPRFAIEPRRIDLGELAAGTDTTVTVTVASRRRSDLEILGVELDAPGSPAAGPAAAATGPAAAAPLAVGFQRAPQDSSTWLVTLRLKPDAPPRPLAEVVRILTNDPVLPSVEIGVFGTLMGGLAFPARVEITSRFAGVVASETVPIRRRQGPAFRITALSVNDPYLRAELVTVEPGEAYAVEITVLPDIPRGHRSALLSVQTDRPDQPHLSIPLIVQVGRAQ
jgi:hypothetical protein